MLDENIVRDLEVFDNDRAVRATYFVEAGVIHAHVEGRTLLLPTGPDTSQEAVRRLLLGQIHTQAWRERTADRWNPRPY